MRATRLFLLCFSTLLCTCVRAQHEGLRSKIPVDTVDTIFPEGVRLESDNFTGAVWVERILKVGEGEQAVAVGNVTFPPKSRSNWHHHPAGQSLLVLGGVGYYQQRGEPVRILRKGQTVECPPDVEHWHGAANDGWFVQLAMTQEHPNGRVKWGVPVTDPEYRMGIPIERAENNRGKAKDNRYRHLARIASLMALNQLDDLGPVLDDALDGGLTINECKEVLIHLYAYTGFPRSINGIRTLMATVEERQERGITDDVGPSASPVNNDQQKYGRGKAVLEELIGRPLPERSDYGDFAPAIDRFLKEHLFADLFERDVLTYQDREVVVVAALASMDGVVPMLRGHLGIALNLGITEDQLLKLLGVIGIHAGTEAKSSALNVLGALTSE